MVPLLNLIPDVVQHVYMFKGLFATLGPSNAYNWNKAFSDLINIHSYMIEQVHKSLNVISSIQQTLNHFNVMTGHMKTKLNSG